MLDCKHSLRKYKTLNRIGKKLAKLDTDENGTPKYFLF